jgi:hypothetical protein
MARALRILPALALVALASCTTDGGNTFIVLEKLIVPTGTPDATGQCASMKLTADLPEDLLPGFAAGTAFWRGLSINNRLPSTVQGTTRLVSNDFFAESAVVSYEAAGSSGTATVPTRTVAVQGKIDTGSKGAVYGELISATDTVALAALGKVRVHVYVKGKLNDGTTVQSSDYDFVVVAGNYVQCVTQ